MRVTKIMCFLSAFGLIIAVCAAQEMIPKDPQLVPGEAATIEGVSALEQEAAPRSDAAQDAAVASPGAPSLQSSATLPAMPGMTVYIDPTTGRFAPMPAEKIEALGPKSAAAETAFSFDGLTEKAAPGGGTMVDLEGRFQSTFTVAVGAGGKLETTCGEVSAAPAAGGNDHE